MLPTIELNILTFLIFFGSLQAFILAAVLLTTPKFRRKSSSYLALLLFSFGLINISTGFYLSGAESKYHVLQYSPHFLVTLIPASFYFFIRYLVEPEYKRRIWDYLIWLIVSVEVIHRFYRFTLYLIHGEQPYASNLKYYFSSNIYESIAMISTLSACIWAIRKLGDHHQLLYQNYAEIEDKSLNWLRTCLMAGLALSVTWMFSLILEFVYDPTQSFLIQAVVIGLTTLTCYIGYAMIIRQGIVDTDVFGIIRDTKSDTKSSDQGLSDKANEHMARVLELVSTDKVYKDPDLNMTKLAELTELSNSYLSQMINQIQGQNFFDFINTYRIEEVKSHMSDPSYDHYTILGLAQEAGFKSKSTFNAVFKKMTGLTPSQYKKSLEAHKT